MNRRGFLSGGVTGAAICALPSVVTASPETLALAAISDADFIALGERHDNPRHHAKQAVLVEALRPAGLAFEMIPAVQEEAVNRMRTEGASRGEIKALLMEAAPGWEWDFYLPIMEAAPDAYIVGGGLAKATLGTLYAKGASGLGTAMTARYQLDTAVPEDLLAEMLDDQYAAHCEMIEREKLGAMVEIQRAWDASYAEALLRASERGGGRAILICGNEHARLDRGVPAYLLHAEPSAKITSIGMLEDGETAVPGRFTATLSAPAPQRDDPCELMRKAMEKG